MVRYVGTKNGIIRVVSDSIFQNDDLTIVEVPSKLDTISSSDLITDVRIKNGKFRSKHTKIPTKELKVAFVSNWMLACGLSTYAENLFPEIAKHVGSFKLFAETNNVLTGDIHKFGDRMLTTEEVVMCWRRGQSLQTLADEIKKYDPDVILLNHEWGCFPNARHWLSFLTQISNYRMIVIMHSVFPNHKDKLTMMAATSEMVVHLEGARKHLVEEKGLARKVHMIPHGCYPIMKAEPIYNMYNTEHTFIQIGFGFAYKQHSIGIKAAALLKKKYADVFFTIIFSESPHAKREHEVYHQDLIELIDELDVRENVGIIRGFQTDECLDAYIRSNRVAVFPYRSFKGHEVYGASGAGRLAMACGVPIITSDIQHFSDLPSIVATTTEEMADALDELFSNETKRRQQIEKQNAYIEKYGWKNIAEMYVDVLTQ